MDKRQKAKLYLELLKRQVNKKLTGDPTLIPDRQLLLELSEDAYINVKTLLGLYNYDSSRKGFPNKNTRNGLSQYIGYKTFEDFTRNHPIDTSKFEKQQQAIERSPLIQLVKNKFGCNLVENPSTRIRPLMLVGVGNGQSHLLPPISKLVKGKFPINENHFETVGIGQFTKQTSANVDYHTLTDMLAYYPNIGNVRHLFTGQETLKLGFRNVQMIGVENYLLQEVLPNIRLDTQQRFVQQCIESSKRRGRKKLQFYIISQTLHIEAFVLLVYNTNTRKLEANWKQLQKNFPNAQIGLTPALNSDFAIQFFQDQTYTYGFNCYELKIGEKGQLLPEISPSNVPPLHFGENTSEKGGQILLSDTPFLDLEILEGDEENPFGFLED